MNATNRQKTWRPALIFIVSLFLVWGLLTVMLDSLVPKLKEIFELNYFQASLIKFAFFLAYGVASIPAGKLLERIGSAKGIQRGLTVMGIGVLLMIPAASAYWYLMFLIGLFVIATGMVILQVAANPLIINMGDPLRASSRLTFAQAFNSIGTTLGPIIGTAYIIGESNTSATELASMTELERIYWTEDSLNELTHIFMVLGCMILVYAFISRFMGLKRVKIKSEKSNLKLDVLKLRGLKKGFLGLFLYVGAEVAIGCFLLNYFVEMGLAQQVMDSELHRGIASFLGAELYFSHDNKVILGTFVSFYWAGMMVGRILGGYIQRLIKPTLVLVLASTLAITLIIISTQSTGFLAMWSILAVGLFNSVMFPIIFSISIKNHKENQAQVSGILCTAIVGGAFIPPVFGLFVDLLGFQYAFYPIILCYGYILWFGVWSSESKLISEPLDTSVQAIQ